MNNIKDEIFPLADLIEQELQLFQNHEIKIDFMADGGALIKGDKFLIRQMLKNIFETILATAKHQLTIGLVQNEKSVILSIKDDGQGTSSAAHEIDRLKKIMELHDSSLTVKKTSLGTEIQFQFPR